MQWDALNSCAGAPEWVYREFPLVLRRKSAVQRIPACNDGQCWRVLGNEGRSAVYVRLTYLWMTWLTVQVMVDGFPDQRE